MKYKRIKTDCYKVVPVIPLEPLKEQEKSLYKKVINELTKMNRPFLEKGRGRKVIIDGEEHYRDVPNFSYKMWLQGGKLHQYMTIAKGEDLQSQLMSAIQVDIESCRFEPAQLHLVHENLFAFAIQGKPSHAIVLDKDFTSKFKSLFSSVSYKDQLLYNLTVKEIEDHNGKRKELKKRLSGYNPDDIKSVIWHNTKAASIATGKFLYDFWFEDEAKQKHQQIIENLKRKGWFQSSTKSPPATKRKLAEKNRYTEVELLFLLWTIEENRAQRFQERLQKLITQMQGENELQVVPVKPDLARIAKGHLQYDLPHLCLYQKELDKFLYLPAIHEMDESFYIERPQKTEIPQDMFKQELGAIAFARDINTNKIIYLPKPRTKEDRDDYSTPVIVPGQMGAGKTVQLSNQVVETFCLRAKDREEWKKNARSSIVFDVADGEMISSILNVVPDWLMDRVVVLNHFDTENPIPVNSHDLLKLYREHGNEGGEFEIAQMETELLLDSLGDKSSTIAVERYYQNALQASYSLGSGTMLDAMKILLDESYRSKMIDELKDRDPVLRYNLAKDDIALRKDERGVTLATIDNHLSQVQNNKPWLDAISQKPHENVDFWRWMNGDKDGAYLVLIYIPEKSGKHLRRYLFAHYFLKIWKLMKLREVIPKSERKECLVIVDEIHQIIDQRAVQKIFGDIFKEPRKYRVRYFFTFHGWSSLEKGGRRKNEIIQSMKDSGCNLIMLKGGKDTFDSVASMLEPYDSEDFNALQTMEYTAIFKIAHGKKSNIFMAKMIEPPDKRLSVHRNVDLTQYKNKFGRNKFEVRKQISEELSGLFEVIQAKEEERQEKKTTKRIRTMTQPADAGIDY